MRRFVNVTAVVVWYSSTILVICKGVSLTIYSEKMRLVLDGKVFQLLGPYPN